MYDSLIMFKINLFCCINWLYIVLNSFRNIGSCSVIFVGCWWDVAIREYEVDGVSATGAGCSMRGKEGNCRQSLIITGVLEGEMADGCIG
jgi:hypothetical protein